MKRLRLGERLPLPVSGWVLLAVALLAALVTLLAAPPAGWADLAVARATAGRVRLAQAEGTLWNGRARVVFADPSAARPDGLAPLQGVVLPGTLTWRLSALPLVIGMLDASVQLEGMRDPMRLTGSFNEIRGGSGSIVLPSVRLDQLGPPWNTVKPDGALSIAWEPFTLRQGVFDGKATLELRNVASALSAVRPLGTYRIEVTGAGGKGTVMMSTLVGPLRLEGNGTFTPAQGLRFTGAASADAAQRAQLAPLLGLVGRRDGERTIIKIGA